MRIVRHLLKQLLAGVDHWEAKLVALLDCLKLKPGRGNEPWVVAEGVVLSAPPHPTDDVLVVLRLVMLDVLSWDHLGRGHWIKWNLAWGSATHGPLLCGMVLYHVSVLLLHDNPSDVRLDRPHRLQLLRLLPQLVQSEEVVLEMLLLKTMSKWILLTRDNVEP